MSRETTNAGKLGKLQNLTAALAANSADLPQFQGSIAQLADLLTQAQAITKQQRELAAQKQQASKQLNAVFANSGRLSTVLQLGVKQHYGITAEKLVEFGRSLSAAASRSRRRKPPLPEPPRRPPTPPPRPRPSSSSLQGVLRHALFLSRSLPSEAVPCRAENEAAAGIRGEILRHGS